MVRRPHVHGRFRNKQTSFLGRSGVRIGRGNTELTKIQTAVGALALIGTTFNPAGVANTRAFRCAALYALQYVYEQVPGLVMQTAPCVPTARSKTVLTGLNNVGLPHPNTTDRNNCSKADGHHKHPAPPTLAPLSVYLHICRSLSPDAARKTAWTAW